VIAIPGMCEFERVHWHMYIVTRWTDNVLLYNASTHFTQHFQTGDIKVFSRVMSGESGYVLWGNRWC